MDCLLSWALPHGSPLFCSVEFMPVQWRCNLRRTVAVAAAAVAVAAVAAVAAAAVAVAVAVPSDLC